MTGYTMELFARAVAQDRLHEAEKERLLRMSRQSRTSRRPWHAWFTRAVTRRLTRLPEAS
jgi:hypothetical protein